MTISAELLVWFNQLGYACGKMNPVIVCWQFEFSSSSLHAASQIFQWLFWNKICFKAIKFVLNHVTEKYLVSLHMLRLNATFHLEKNKIRWFCLWSLQFWVWNNKDFSMYKNWDSSMMSAKPDQFPAPENLVQYLSNKNRSQVLHAVTFLLCLYWFLLYGKNMFSCNVSLYCL